MSFRLINNRTQSIAVKGFAATVALTVLLQLFHILPVSVTLPFIMPWMLVWLIGYSMQKKG